MVFGKRAKPAVNLGTRSSLADIGKTIAGNFQLHLPAGHSFLSNIIVN
jgi:phosphopentomutase